MKDFASKIHAFGKALMMPISVIAAAGIFLGVAAAMQNPAITGETFANLFLPQLIIQFIRNIAGALFANLPVLFAIAIATGQAKAEKSTAGVFCRYRLYRHAYRRHHHACSTGNNGRNHDASGPAI